MRAIICAALVAIATGCGEGGGETTGWKQPSSAVVRMISVLVDGTRVLVGTQTGLLVTTDDGKSMAPSTTGLPTMSGVTSPVEALIVSGTAVFAGTDDGTFISNDHGNSWSNANSGLPIECSPYAFWNVGAVTLVGMNTGSPTGGLFRTDNRGTSSTRSSTGLSQAEGPVSFAQLGTTVFTA